MTMRKNAKNPSKDYLKGLHDGIVMLGQMIIKDIDKKPEKQVPMILLNRLDMLPKMAKQIIKDLAVTP